ncbi:MAG: multidrug efflux MFS transporter [Chloroflexi bacterium]|nr:multidrug efflux MFS transporter [Chloroflexota bacterium]
MGAEAASSLEEKILGIDRKWLTLVVTSIGGFMALLDSTIVNIALPTIMRDFNSTLQNGQLVLTIYLLALAIIIPTSGYLTDKLGLKRLYIQTLVLFVLGSTVCGLAWNLPSLVLFRALQGLGGGMLQPLGMAVVFTVVTPLERAKYMSILGLPMVLAPIIGPTVGGFLVEYASWRTIFLINIPIGVTNIVLASWLLRQTPRNLHARLDLRGLCLSVVAFPCLLLGLSFGEQNGWTSPLVAVLLLVGFIALLLLIRVELRTPDPLLLFSLYRARMFRLAMGMNFISQFSLFGMQYLLPLFLQLAHHTTAAQTGVILFPTGICAWIAMTTSSRLYNRIGPKPLVMSGLAVLLVASALLSRVNQDTSVLYIGILGSMRGFGQGLAIMPTSTMAFNTVPHEQISKAPAFTNVMFRLFASTTAAILTTILVTSVRLHGAPPGTSITAGTAPITATVAAFSDAFIAMSILCAFGILGSFFMRDAVLDEHRALQAETRASLSGGRGERLATAAEA